MISYHQFNVKRQIINIEIDHTTSDSGSSSDQNDDDSVFLHVHSFSAYMH